MFSAVRVDLSKFVAGLLYRSRVIGQHMPASYSNRHQTHPFGSLTDHLIYVWV